MKQVIYLSLMVALISLECGCSTFTNDRPLTNPFKKMLQSEAGPEEVAQSTISKMAVIWKDTTFSGGTKSVRGFGGRVFFFDENNQPVKADGEFVVYGFDDSENPDQGTKADRKYVFERERLSEHYSESEMGPSYSFWIPWEKAGGLRKTITLIPVFKTAEGRVVKSGQSIQTLPGKAPERQAFSKQRSGNKVQSIKVLGSSPALIRKESAASDRNVDSGIMQASFNESADGADDSVKSRTSTFMLPSSMATRIESTNRQLKQQLESKKPAAVSDLPNLTDQPKPVAIKQSVEVSVPATPTGNRWNSTSTDPADMIKRLQSQIPRTSRKSMMLDKRAGESVEAATDLSERQTHSSSSPVTPVANSVGRIYGQPGSIK